MLSSWSPDAGCHNISGCFKMRCPFLSSKQQFGGPKRKPHFETYLFRHHVGIWNQKLFTIKNHGFNWNPSKLKWDVLNQPQEVRHGSLVCDSQDLCKNHFATVPLVIPSGGRARDKEFHLEHFVRHPCRQAGWEWMEQCQTQDTLKSQKTEMFFLGVCVSHATLHKIWGPEFSAL